jgi:hypothetical protein
MFRTITVHPQELLFRCCMCRLWYVLIRPAGFILYQIAAVHLYSFSLMFSYICIIFACQVDKQECHRNLLVAPRMDVFKNWNRELEFVHLKRKTGVLEVFC